MLKKQLVLMRLLFKHSLVLGGEKEECCWCWVNVEPRAPGGYLSSRGSECSPVSSLQREAVGIWIGVPPGPCGAPSCKDPGELREEAQRGSPTLFVCLFVWI